METVSPQNFRTNPFHLFNKDLLIGGMARPDNNMNIDAALSYLVKNANRTVLIGLKEESYAEVAEKNGLEYHHLPIEDFQPVPTQTYDALYELIKHATEQGKEVTVHCGAGNGRTGTALASLKLREILWRDYKQNPAVLDESPNMTDSITCCMAGNVVCTPRVKQAVELIRNERSTPPDKNDNGVHSVETGTDINNLVAYEKHLQAQFKNELGLYTNTSTVELPTVSTDDVKDADTPKELSPISIDVKQADITKELSSVEKVDEDQKLSTTSTASMDSIDSIDSIEVMEVVETDATNADVKHEKHSLGKMFKNALQKIMNPVCFGNENDVIADAHIKTASQDIKNKLKQQFSTIDESDENIKKNKL